MLSNDNSIAAQQPVAYTSDSLSCYAWAPAGKTTVTPSSFGMPKPIYHPSPLGYITANEKNCQTFAQ